VTDEAEPPVEFGEFLESHPPGSRATVVGAVERRSGLSGPWVSRPELQLHCASDKCRGTRYFACEDWNSLSKDDLNTSYLKYNCRNCGESLKVFSLAFVLQDNVVVCLKIGELPAFGPPTPSRVISIIGPDREIFLRGRRAENQGLGIGAHAYYRRVVENQWQRIVAEIIRVAETSGSSSEMIRKLEEARSETQFSKALDLIKDAIPESLKIRGHNPLKLLHRALSEGIHDLGDEQCLSLASSIRVVLTELADRVGQALKDERELQDALNRLSVPK